jgi:hypothetical protein
MSNSKRKEFEIVPHMSKRQVLGSCGSKPDGGEEETKEEKPTDEESQISKETETKEEGAEEEGRENSYGYPPEELQELTKQLGAAKSHPLFPEYLENMKKNDECLKELLETGEYVWGDLAGDAGEDLNGWLEFLGETKEEKEEEAVAEAGTSAEEAEPGTSAEASLAVAEEEKNEIVAEEKNVQEPE